MKNNFPSADEVRRYLKEAGSYDPTLRSSEMYELYKVLEDSKNTATKDDEHHSIIEETDMNSSMIEDLRQNSVLVEEEVDGNQVIQDSDSEGGQDFEVSLKKIQETKIITPKANKTSTKFNEKSPVTVNKEMNFDHLDVCNPVPTSHKPLTKIYIQPKYSAPFYCRPEILALNLDERERLIGEFHTKLLNDLNYCQRQATLSAPWGKPIKSSNTFNGSIDKLLDISLPIDDDDDVTNLDTDVVFTSRAGRQTKRKLYTEVNDNSNDKQVFPTKKRPNLSTLKNEEIMKTSKLFSNPRTRAEKIFDNLIKEEPKKIEAEKEMDAFTSSLISASDEDDIAEIIHSEEPFQKRRITPPSRKRAPPRRKPALKKTELEVQTSPVTKKPAAVVQNVIKKGICPLCHEYFFQEELQAHAATCCEELERIADKVVTRNTRGRKKTITCEACDEVFTLNNDYEVHVVECLKRKKRN